MNAHSKKRINVPNLRMRVREATCDAITEAAEEVFGAQGLRGAHVGQIAARAGVSIGTLYNHFADRDALLAALIRRRTDELLERLDDALLRDEGRPFRDQLGAFVGALFEHVQAHHRFFSLLIEQGSGKPKEAMADVLRRVEELVKRGVRSRALRARGADLYPALLMGMVRGLLVHGFAHRPAASPTAHVEALVDLFLDGAGSR
jgi:AcrR family transcriptional regulator